MMVYGRRGSSLPGKRRPCQQEVGLRWQELVTKPAAGTQARVLCWSHPSPLSLFSLCVSVCMAVARDVFRHIAAIFRMRSSLLQLASKTSSSLSCLLEALHRPLRRRVHPGLRCWRAWTRPGKKNQACCKGLNNVTNGMVTNS